MTRETAARIRCGERFRDDPGDCGPHPRAVSGVSGSAMTRERDDPEDRGPHPAAVSGVSGSAMTRETAARVGDGAPPAE